MEYKTDRQTLKTTVDAAKSDGELTPEERAAMQAGKMELRADQKELANSNRTFQKEMVQNRKTFRDSMKP